MEDHSTAARRPWRAHDFEWPFRPRWISHERHSFTCQTSTRTHFLPIRHWEEWEIRGFSAVRKRSGRRSDASLSSTVTFLNRSSVAAGSQLCGAQARLCFCRTTAALGLSTTTPKLSHNTLFSPTVSDLILWFSFVHNFLDYVSYKQKIRLVAVTFLCCSLLTQALRLRANFFFNSLTHARA